MRIAVDAMGGDYAPQAVVAGAAQALADFPQITQLLLIGQTERIEAELRLVGCTDPRIKIISARDVLEMHEQPVLALRAWHNIGTARVATDASRLSFDDAKRLTLEAVAPLGPEYVAATKQGFDNRWMDAYPRPRKLSGAHMAGVAYDVHPYVLLNFNDDYESVTTLAHE